MAKTIEEMAREYANEKWGSITDCPSVGVVKRDAQQGFVAGANAVLSLPLVDRLTDSERERIRAIYHECELIEMNDNPNLSAEIVGNAGVKMELLESIFGKNFFNENK